MSQTHGIRIPALKFATIIPLIACCAQWGCQEHSAGPAADRGGGPQVEAFAIADGTLQRFDAQAPTTRASAIDPGDGEAIRSNDDVVTIQVESAYLNDVSSRVAGAKDVVIFADVWENAATGYNSPSLTSIVYAGKNQTAPGRLKFRDALAYGPTKFKGHPLRIRFSMIVLGKPQGEQEGSTIDVINAFAVTAAPQYGVVTSEVAKSLQSVLRGQKDAAVFDFETTLLSDRPQGIVAVATTAPVEGAGQTQWLRYGRFALVEPAFKEWQPDKISVEDGWLRFAPKSPQGVGEPVPANYLVVRITPHQLAEDDEMMRAAAVANQDVFSALQRSDAEIAATINKLSESSQTLGDEILRIKAEKLARMYGAQVQVTGDAASQRQALAELFDGEWNKVVTALPDSRQGSAAKAGAAVLARWQAKFDPNSPAPLPDPLALQITRDQLRVKLLADAGVPIGPRTFTITSAKVERDESKRYTVLEVGLAPTPTDNNTSVSKMALWNVIEGKANGFLVEQLSLLPGTTTITSVKLDAASAAALATTLTTP